MDQARAERRRTWKRNARAVVKKHYVILLLLVLLGIFYGGEFQYVKSQYNDTYKLFTGRDPQSSGAVLEIGSSSPFEFTFDLLGINDELQQEDQEKAADNQSSSTQKAEKISGGSRGIFSSVANYFSSGGLTNALLEAGVSVFHSKGIVVAIMIIASFLLYIFIWLFLKNIYIAVLRRMFLEARIYDKVLYSHVLHFIAVKRWKKAALSMARYTICLGLWWLTIIGGIIKTYSYEMVPYIIAENPDISGKEAISLSRRMMNGHKMEAFILDISFLFWDLLGYVSFGLVSGMWAVPYKTAAFSEMYAYLREEAKSNGLEGAERLNDDYLFRVADRALLEDTYVDTEAQKYYIDTHRVTLPPVRAFFAKNFGVWLGNTAEKAQYDEVDNRRQQIKDDRAVIRGELYPQRLNPLWVEDSYHFIKNARSIRTYTVVNIILFFFIFSFVGWGWEVSLHLLKDGIFVNRGVMHGPWLPVYGSGVVMILVVLFRWRRRPIEEALLTILLCGFVEYMTSYYLEITKGMRWWDYTGYFLNLNGRICGEGLTVFCIGGMAAVYLLVPLIDASLSHINPKFLAALGIVLVLTFSADMVYSHYVPNVGEGITDYEAYKESCIELTITESPELPSGDFYYSC